MVSIEIDNRGLSSPEPMLRILSALKTLDDADELVSFTDHEPVLLFPELERRGYTWEGMDADGHYVVTIRRRQWD